MCYKLACISTFSFKPAYGEPNMLLVFMNMETRRYHYQVTCPFRKKA
nr:MAG TPA: HypF [Caudoviricetes sp.]